MNQNMKRNGGYFIKITYNYSTLNGVLAKRRCSIFLNSEKQNENLEKLIRWFSIYKSKKFLIEISFLREIYRKILMRFKRNHESSHL